MSGHDRGIIGHDAGMAGHDTGTVPYGAGVSLRIEQPSGYAGGFLSGASNARTKDDDA